MIHTSRIPSEFSARSPAEKEGAQEIASSFSKDAEDLASILAKRWVRKVAAIQKVKTVGETTKFRGKSSESLAVGV